jgi:hypothetical protein
VNAALPLVIDATIALLPTLPGWSGVVVLDGPQVTAAAPREYVTVGFVDGEDFGGTFEPIAGLGDLLEETGSVRSEIVCWTGDVNFPAMRARAFALFNAWNAAVQADVTLGGVVATSSLSGEVVPVQNDKGSAVRLVATLAYIARGI